MLPKPHCASEMRSEIYAVLKIADEPRQMVGSFKAFAVSFHSLQPRNALVRSADFQNRHFMPVSVNLRDVCVSDSTESLDATPQEF